MSEVRLNLRVSPELKEGLARLCAGTRKTESDVIRELAGAAVEHFDEHGRLLFPVRVYPRGIGQAMRYLERVKKTTNGKRGKADECGNRE